MSNNIILRLKELYSANNNRTFIMMFFVLHYILSLYHAFLVADMSGMAAEGSQFDARQYDSKMNELYCVFPFPLYFVFRITVSLHGILCKLLNLLMFEFACVKL